MRHIVQPAPHVPGHTASGFSNSYCSISGRKKAPNCSMQAQDLIGMCAISKSANKEKAHPDNHLMQHWRIWQGFDSAVCPTASKKRSAATVAWSMRACICQGMQTRSFVELGLACKLSCSWIALLVASLNPKPLNPKAPNS